MPTKKKAPARRAPAPTPAAPWIELATGAAWIIGIAAALQLLELFLGQSPLGTAILGALIVDLAAGRAGLRWAAADPGPSTRASLRLVGLGAAAALAIAVVVVGAGAIAGLVEIDHGHPSWALGLGVVRASGLAVRDELLLRGLVLHFARRARIPLPYAVAFAALTSPATIALTANAPPEALALSFASGLLYACLWVRTGSAFAPVAAHATWLLLTGVVLRGGFLDVFWEGGVLSAARASGAPGWIAAVAFVAIALVARRFAHASSTAK